MSAGRRACGSVTESLSHCASTVTSGSSSDQKKPPVSLMTVRLLLTVGYERSWLSWSKWSGKTDAQTHHRDTKAGRASHAGPGCRPRNDCRECRYHTGPGFCSRCSRQNGHLRITCRGGGESGERSGRKRANEVV